MGADRSTALVPRILHTADWQIGKPYRWIDDVATIDALGRPIRGRYLVSEDGTRAVIELAEASGLARVAADERDILQSTTYGTGVLIGDAIAHGVREVIVTRTFSYLTRLISRLPTFSPPQPHLSPPSPSLR